MPEENLSVSWDKYEKNICKGLGALQQRGEFVDMTLAADGHHVKVHQMVLSLVSPFIKDLIRSANCPHPVIFLNRVSYQTMQAIMEYAYTGEVVVKKEKIGEFLEACKDLHIKGLENMLETARTTIHYEIRTERDNTETEGEDNAVPSDSRRKRLMQKNIFEESVQSEDDFHQTNVMEDTDENEPLSQNFSAIVDDKVTPDGSDLMLDSHTKKSAAVQYSVSCQGNLQIVVNRFLYALRHTRKNEQRFWRCISQQSTNCPAIVTTLQDTIIERSFPHNHPFHDTQILKRLKNGNLFNKLNEVEIAAAAKQRRRKDADPFKTALNET